MRSKKERYKRLNRREVRRAIRDQLNSYCQNGFFGITHVDVARGSVEDVKKVYAEFGIKFIKTERRGEKIRCFGEKEWKKVIIVDEWLADRNLYKENIDKAHELLKEDTSLSKQPDAGFLLTEAYPEAEYFILSVIPTYVLSDEDSNVQGSTMFVFLIRDELGELYRGSLFTDTHASHIARLINRTKPVLIYGKKMTYIESFRRDNIVPLFGEVIGPISSEEEFHRNMRSFMQGDGITRIEARTQHIVSHAKKRAQKQKRDANKQKRKNR